MGMLTFHKSLHPQVSLPLLPLARREVVDSPTDGFLGVRTARRSAARKTPHRKIDMTKDQTGTVKWFNESKGYGFIAPDDGGKDLFAHFREIQGADGYKTLAENARVQFVVTQGPKGPQASNIRPIA
jgi:CspA family cold shock protein